MPKPFEITAGNRGMAEEDKPAKTVMFSTFSEVKAAFANGGRIEPWGTVEEFYKDAFAQRVVRIQGPLRPGSESGSGKSKSKKDQFLD